MPARARASTALFDAVHGLSNADQDRAITRAEQLLADGKQSRRLATQILLKMPTPKAPALRRRLRSLLHDVADKEAHAQFLAAILFGLYCHGVHAPRVGGLMRLQKHPSAEVRKNLSLALARSTHREAARCVAALSRDPVRRVRVWATWVLREGRRWQRAVVDRALIARLRDRSAEVRGDALVGLAIRKHPSASDWIRDELRRSRRIRGEWVFEAARLSGDADLLPDIRAVRRQGRVARPWLSALAEAETELELRSYDSARSSEVTS